MSFPLVNALNLQGILVVIGYVMGPIAVVTFNTARTISRSAVQGMNLINNSIWPEMSAAFGMGAMDTARMLHRRACQISLLLCLAITLGVAFLGDWIWRVWTVGKVPTDPVLLNIMLLQMVVSAFWFTSSVVPMATNQHQRMARVMLAATCLALLLAWLLMHVDFARSAGCGDRAGGRRPVHCLLCVARESAVAGGQPGRLCAQHAGFVAAAALWRRPKLPRQRGIKASSPQEVDSIRPIPVVRFFQQHTQMIGPSRQYFLEKWSSHPQKPRLRADALLRPNS